MLSKPSTIINSDHFIKKNAIFNVEEISAEPGENFSQWKEITARLLKEREYQLMTIRCDATKSIINQAIQTFASNNDLSINARWDFDSNYQQKTLDELCKLINSWSGVRISRLKCNKMNAFKSYFVIGKNWCDQNKKKVWAPFFWVKILKQIHAFAHETAYKHWLNKCALKQKELANCLELQIMNAIFNKTVQFARTKKQPLIPNGTLKQNKGIKQYLLDLDVSLSVDEWCKLQTTKQKAVDAFHNETKKRTGNAKLLVQQLKDTLYNLLVASQNKLRKQKDVDWCTDTMKCAHRSDTDHVKIGASSNAQTPGPELDAICYVHVTYDEMHANHAMSSYYDKTSTISPVRTGFTKINPLPPLRYVPHNVYNGAPSAPHSFYEASRFGSKTVSAQRYSPLNASIHSINSNCCECCQCYCAMHVAPNFL